MKKQWLHLFTADPDSKIYTEKHLSTHTRTNEMEAEGYSWKF